MASLPSPDLILSFPELSHSDALIIAQELEQELLRSGISKEEVSIVRSDKEAMDLGGLLMLFGTHFLEGAAQQLGRHSLDWLIEKYKVFIVAKAANGQNWTYGSQYRKGIQSVVRKDAGSKFGTLGLILFGASEFPGMNGLDNPAFARSADLIRRTLTPEYLLFAGSKELNLFDTNLSPLETIERVEEFIDGSPDINDFLFYYCGHGSYLRDRDRSYFLTLKTTRAGKEAFTGLKLHDFRQSLEGRLANRRLYLVLDCCFSGEAAREFMSDNSQEFMRNQIAEALPPSGWAVITASPRTMVAMSPEGFDYTMFTGAFAETLRSGSPFFKTHFSLADLTDETRRRIIQTHGHARAVAPLCVAAAQKDGDLTRVPLFVNKAFDDTPPPPTPDDMEKFEAMAREFDSLFPASRKAALENVYALWMRTPQPEVKERIATFFSGALEDDSFTVRGLAVQYNAVINEPKPGAEQKNESPGISTPSDNDKKLGLFDQNIETTRNITYRAGIFIRRVWSLLNHPFILLIITIIAISIWNSANDQYNLYHRSYDREDRDWAFFFVILCSISWARKAIRYVRTRRQKSAAKSEASG